MKTIIFDMDGTLTNKPMPNFEILKKIGFKKGLDDDKFKSLVNERVKDTKEDEYLALYKTYLKVIRDNKINLTDKELKLNSDKIIYNKGVKEFLEKLSKDNKLYLLSSGIKVYLENTEVAKYFEDIYATTFKYSGNKIKDVDYVMSDKNKEDAIKDIKTKNKISVKDIIYFGDGLTDYYAFKYVQRYGGKCIYVYSDKDNEDIKIIKKQNIINKFLEADYSKDSKLYKYTKKLL